MCFYSPRCCCCFGVVKPPANALKSLFCLSFLCAFFLALPPYWALCTRASLCVSWLVGARAPIGKVLPVRKWTGNPRPLPTGPRQKDASLSSCAKWCPYPCLYCSIPRARRNGLISFCKALQTSPAYLPLHPSQCTPALV